MSKQNQYSRTLVKIGKTIDALPKAFNLLPSTDYQALISHSGAALQSKAWRATGLQMQDAINTVENNVSRKPA